LAEPYIQKKIPTSDSTLPEYEVVGKEEIFHIWVCKVCKKPFAENQEKVVCEKCSHYCHAEHSGRYQTRVLDHLCLADEIGVNKQSYKVLYGISHGNSNRRIQNATKLQPNELGFIITDLRKAGLVRNKLLFFTETTYKAHECLPVLEEIYSKEKDVEEYVAQLAGGSSGIHVGLPSISSRSIVFAIFSLGIIVIALIVGGAVLSLMRSAYAPSGLTAIVWILVMLAAIYAIYKLRRLFT
jgi:hypothetical protein